MGLATNLDDVYRVCDPDRPLSADDDRYVDLSVVRGTKVIATIIARRIGRCTDGRYYQQLFSGHRGSGKSTELLRLKKELEDRRFFTVYIDVEELLDLVEVNYLDVLLSIAKQTEQVLRESGIPLSKNLLQDLEQWFSEKIIKEDQGADFSGNIHTQAHAGSTIPFFASLMAKLTAEIKTASSRRITTRQILERELAVFIDRLNTLLLDARNQVRKNDHKDIVLIIDGLEKIHYRMLADGYSSHAHLFVLHAEQLKAPQCHIIYTMPISLAFNANLGNDFDDIQILPMVKTNPDGIACLHEVIAKRIDIDKTFVKADFVDQLAELSGGVIRDLMRLVRLATDTDKEKIGQAEIDYARATLIREYDRLLRDDELERLRWVRDHRRVTGDEAFARLLNLRLVLEYQNGERWAAPHPAVERIPWVKQRLSEPANEPGRPTQC